MATISNTPRPGYVWDATDNVWYPIGVGGHSHSEIASTIADAKGDLIVGTAADTVARLAVGSDGETLVADSSTATGLRYTENYAAGKNKIINGDLAINQRAFTSTTTSSIYGFDRWQFVFSGGTVTHSAQTFTAGTAPVTGYEATNFARVVTASQSAAGDFAAFLQKIEDVRTLANQTATISFWAKASTGTPKIGLAIDQQFGTGGSAGVVTAVQDVTISSSWARYTATVTFPSVSGKTIGANSSVNVDFFTSCGANLSAYTSIGIQNVTIDIWGVQVEEGSVATAFQTATGTLQGELAACQRYFLGLSSALNVYTNFGVGVYGTSTIAQIMVPLPVTMRVQPSISVGTVGNYSVDGVTGNACSNLTAGQLGNQMIGLSATTAASTIGYGCYLRASNTASALIQISAEL
jgi:hypothetical protein